MNMRSARSVGVCGMAVVGMLSAAGCGTDRVVSVVAPSSVAALSAQSDGLGLHTISPAASTTTSSTVTVTSLVGGTNCPTLQFMVSSYVIKTAASTVYTGGSCASIQAGTVLVFSGTRPSNYELVFYADTIAIKSGQATPAPTPPAPATGQTEVTVSSLVTGTTCPYLQFRSGTYVFQTSSATKYENGGCTAIKAGLTIALGGTKQSDTQVLVSSITFKKDGSTTTTPAPTVPEPPVEDTEPVEIDAVVSSLVSGSACPYLQFAAGDERFITARGTRFDGGQCDDVTPGSRLRVSGARRKTDGTVLVSGVVFTHEDAPPAAPAAPVIEAPPPKVVESVFIVNTVASASKCPTLLFAVAGYYLSTDEKTEYVDGSCSDIKAKVRVSVRGVVTGEKSVLVTRVAFPE
jgi:hypothetical protein